MRLCSPSPHAASPQIPPRRSFLKAAAIAPVSQAHQSLRARGDGPRGGEGAGILRPQAARVRDNARHGGEGGEPSGARTRKRRNSLVRAAARAEGVGAAGGASGDGERSDWRVARVIRVLREDLPVQYERDLDWSVYDGSVAFVDPVTRLDGLILYRGMISSLRLITAVGFEPGSVVFELHSIEEVPPSARTFSPFPRAQAWRGGWRRQWAQ
ncbi:hypothetical protein CLOM_g8489 [Closterium sp. NIES-68]|nr:hypothetical protein CLOM_g8489 [Closterium sp. NIES-68]